MTGQRYDGLLGKPCPTYQTVGESTHPANFKDERQLPVPDTPPQNVATANSDEIWMPMVGHEERYLISNYGRAKSAPRQHPSHNRSYTGQILRVTVEKDGYQRLNVNRPDLGRTIHVRVHRAVAQAFLPNPNNHPMVNHRDGCKTNNHVSNLEWVTASENSRHAVKMGVWPKSQFDPSKHALILKDVQKWMAAPTPSQIAVKHAVPISRVKTIIKAEKARLGQLSK